MKRFSAFLIISIIISGCAKQTAKENSTVIMPRAVAVPAAAKCAVDVVGGETAWGNTQVIIGECTAKFYRPDGTFYLTRQRHAIYPWSDSIRIYDAEPQGTFVWQLTGNELRLLAGTCQQEATLPMTLSDEYIARGIWSVMAAPARAATGAEPDAALGEGSRVEGLWHYPLTLRGGQTLFGSKDDNHFDIYTTETKTPAILMARAYDYRTIEKTGIAVPSKIEIFTADSPTAPPHRIIEFDYQRLESVGF